MKRKKFNPGVRITIFFVIFAVVFFSLGIWQIERGQTKTQIMSEFENKLKCVMADLRFQINSQNLDLFRILTALGYKSGEA